MCGTNKSIDSGFKIDSPNVFIPWNVSENDLKKILGKHLHYITNGYYTITCKSLGSLEHELGFHFTPQSNGVLKELEFFRKNFIDLEISFKQFQEYFEKMFGVPTKISTGTVGYPEYEWQVNGVRIVHYVLDRFGPEEHMRIIKS